MAGLTINMPFVVGFVMSETVNLLFRAGKEGLLMVMKGIKNLVREIKSFVERFAKIIPWEACLLSGFSLLTSQ